MNQGMPLTQIYEQLLKRLNNNHSLVKAFLLSEGWSSPEINSAKQGLKARGVS